MDTPGAEDVRSAASALHDSPAYRLFVRGGLIAYGIVHLLVAYLAARVALGQPGEDPSQTGALRQLAEAPLGVVLLAAVAVGLAVIGLWQLLTAVLRRGSDPATVWRERIAAVVRAGVYGALAVAAFGIAAGPRPAAPAGGTTPAGGATPDGGQVQEAVSAGLLGLPGGRVLVVLIGLAVLGYGAYYVIKGIRAGYEKDLAGTLTGAADALARVGHIAKGIAILIVGGLFAWAGVTRDPNEAGGLDDALAVVRSAPLGAALLLAMAAGLAAYGIYCFFWSRRARFR